MNTRTMSLSTVLTTNLPSKIVNVIGVGTLSFFFGETLGGFNGGIAGAIAGLVVAIVGQILSNRALMNKQKTEGAISIDQERDRVMERANQVHQQEVEFLRSAHQKELEFMRRQVTYHETLELTVRKRLHSMVGEVQRCALHIRLQDAEMIENKLKPLGFEVRNFQDIVEMYPLPDAPQQYSADSTKALGPK